MPPTDLQAQPEGAPMPNKADVLDYAGDIIAELRDLAHQTGCSTLAGILDVARLEAALKAAEAVKLQGRKSDAA